MRSLRRGLPALAAVLVLLVPVAGCSFRSGAAESESGWKTKVDQTLGTAVSSLGTAELLLENQANGHLTHNFVVVGMRESLQTLETETATFVALQPPPSEAKANRQAVTALGKARAVLNAASTAATDGSNQERAQALREVRRTYQDVQKLSDELAGSG